MSLKNHWKKLVIIIAVFLGCYYLPVGNLRFDNSITEALHLVKWYAREHVLLCLVPAFFIAGAISVFISQASVMKYLGARANKILAYGVASVSGSILAVCSCTVLPLFAGIYKMDIGIIEGINTRCLIEIHKELAAQQKKQHKEKQILIAVTCFHKSFS